MKQLAWVLPLFFTHLSGDALAAPSQRGLDNIRNATPARVLADDENPRLIWLFPRDVGRATITESSVTVGNDICYRLKEVEDDNRNDYDAIRNLKETERSFERQLTNPNLSDEDVERIEKALDRTIRSRNRAQSRIDQSVQAFTSKDGGKLIVQFSVDGLLEDTARLKSDNPGYQVAVIDMPSSEVLFRSGEIRDNQPQSDFIRYEFVTGIGGTINGQRIPYASKFNSTLILSQYGACKYTYPDLYQAQRGGYTAQVRYTYPQRWGVEISGTYNRKRIYEHVVKVRNKSGFFSSSTMKEVMESDWGENALAITIRSGNPQQPLTFEQQMSILSEVKLDLLLTLAKDFTPPGASAQDVPGDLAVSNRRGARVAADELQRCPDAYCQIGAGVLRVLDSVFGSSSVSSSYISRLDQTTRIQYNLDTTVLRENGTIDYR
jgi:hypothetical protein